MAAHLKNLMARSQQCILCYSFCYLVLSICTGIGLYLGADIVAENNLDVELEEIEDSTAVDCTVRDQLLRTPRCEESSVRASNGMKTVTEYLTCFCPVSLEVTGRSVLSAGAAVNVTAEIIVKEVFADQNPTTFCRDELRTPPYATIKVTGASGSTWACGPLSKSFVSCVLDIKPHKQMACLKARDGKIRVGSMTALIETTTTHMEWLDTVESGMRSLVLVFVVLAGALVFFIAFLFFTSARNNGHEPSRTYQRDVVDPAAIGASKMRNCRSCGGDGQRGIFGPTGFGFFVSDCEVCFGKGLE